MTDAIITLITAFFARGWYQPIFHKYAEIRLSQGYSETSFQGPLALLALAIDILTVVMVYAFIHLFKCLNKYFIS